MENSTEQKVNALIDELISGTNPNDNIQRFVEQVRALGEPGMFSDFERASGVSGPQDYLGGNYFQYYTGANAFMDFSSYSYVPQTFTSYSTQALSPKNQNRTLEDSSVHIHALQEANASLHLEIQRLEDLLKTKLDEKEMTGVDLFLLNQRQRMEKKGWILAFLSPSVVELLEKFALSEFLEGDLRFIYDAKVDYTQEEARVLAVLAQEKSLLPAFNSGKE